MQIVVAALVMGCLFFMAIVLFLNPPTDLQASDFRGLLTCVLIGFTVMALVGRAVVPSAIVSAGVRRLAQSHSQETDPTAVITALWGLLHTRTIVAGALLEGVAFFALISYMLEKSPLALLLAVVLIIALAMHFPTRSWADRWIEARLESMDQDRQFGRQVGTESRLGSAGAPPHLGHAQSPGNRH
jgi:hypothetical protein